MKVKVLSNGFSCDGWWLKRKMGDDYDPDSEKVLDHIVGWERTMIDPIFNREGWYCTKDKCWREIKLPSGRLVAVLTNEEKQYFNYHMNMLNAEEKPIPDDIWESIELLIKKKYLSPKDYFFERYRRASRKQKIDSKKRHMAFMKRVYGARK